MEFYVIMQKRKDLKVYPDLHKTNQIIYLNYKDAEEVFNNSDHFKEYYHIVPLVAVTQDDYYNSLLISKTKPVYRHRGTK